jgi:hypothetical protein
MAPTADTPAPAAHTLDEAAAARYLNFEPATLKSWRYRGRGPAYIRVGRSVRYRLPDLDEWQVRHRIDPDRGEY